MATPFDLDLMGVVPRLCTASRVVVLTGAGASEESGIPTFRDEQTGLWKRYDPMLLATREAFDKDPKLVWDWYTWRRQVRRDAKPNAGHYALAQMQDIFSSFVVVTQNVDGLHRAAGSHDVIELHGNLQRSICSREYVAVEQSSAHATLDGMLACPKCGAPLRPDVIWFGEPLPRAAIERAYRLSSECDLFASVGTSAVVEPAASLPRIAKRSGAFLIEINPSATPISEIADVRVRGKAGKVLPELLRHLRGENRGAQDP